jgi:hypothetical protein
MYDDIIEDFVCDYDSDNATSIHSDIISLSKQKHINNAYKQTDADYCKIRRLVHVRIKDQIVPKKVNIECYSTKNTPGVTIRDAVTGTRIADNRVGSIKEDLFFKVKLSTGEVKDNITPLLFFDSPEQYERKFGCTVDNHIKQLWRTKNTNARAYFSQQLQLSE